MQAWKLKTITLGVIAVVLSACGGGGSDPGSSGPVDQAIAFATPGTASGAVGTALTNTASGGGGTGGVSYLSSNISIATVNPTTGVATLMSVGSTTITATKAASSGFNQATSSYTLNVTAGAQTISFSQAGPLQVLKGFTANNVASGGTGTGAISYGTSNAAIATVDPASGVATGVTAGTATITATKAADANYTQAQATYSVTVQTQASMSAWIGPNDSQVTLPTIANGSTFIRTTDRNCNLASFSTCAGVQFSTAAGVPITAAGVPITDIVANVGTTAYYSLKNGSATTNALAISTKRFSERGAHTALFYNNRYWVIGGFFFNISSAKNDVWSSADGKTWELETGNAAFAPRFYHQSVVFGGKMWVIGGISATGALTNDVWSSTDGKNWTQVAANTPFVGDHEDLNVIVFNGAMWAVYLGRTYSSTDGIAWMPQSAAGAIDSGIPRGFATFTSYGGKLWYIAGRQNYPSSPSTTSTVNDVWSSTDGIVWTKTSTTAPFVARWRHAAFVMNNKLWILGGENVVAGVSAGATSDVWSTDGVTWTQESPPSGIARSSWISVVQETNKVTFIGGVLGGITNKVWQSTDGNHWNYLSSFAQFSPRQIADAVEFLGDMWVIAGGTAETLTTNEIWRSNDGINWTQVIPVGPVFSPRDGHQVIVFNNRLWVIGGWDDLISTGGTETRFNDVWSSADGINWSQQVPSGAIFSPRVAPQAVVFNSKLWLVGGDTATGTFANDVWSTADGVTWVQETASAAFPARSSHKVVELNNTLWLTGGQNSSTVFADVWKSTDGKNWSLVTPLGASFPARSGHAVTVYNNRMWLTGGWNGLSWDGAGNASDYYVSTRFNDVWSTTDGVNWVQATPAAQFDRRVYPALVNHNNELWLIGGLNFDRFNDVWRSTDGVNWRVGFNQNFTTN